MKKFIQLFSLFSLIFVLTTLTVSAQSDFGSEVQVPFNFSFGDRDYEAGKYLIQVTNVQSGSAAISIVDTKNNIFQRVFAQRNNDETESKVDFVFERLGDTRTLSRIVTPDGGFAINGRRQRRDAAAAKNTKREAIGTASSF